MKHLAVALIVITLLLCDFGAEQLGLKSAGGWSRVSTVGILYAAWFFISQDGE